MKRQNRPMTFLLSRGFKVTGCIIRGSPCSIGKELGRTKLRLNRHCCSTVCTGGPSESEMAKKCPNGRRTILTLFMGTFPLRQEIIHTHSGRRSMKTVYRTTHHRLTVLSHQRSVLISCSTLPHSHSFQPFPAKLTLPSGASGKLQLVGWVIDCCVKRCDMAWQHTPPSQTCYSLMSPRTLPTPPSMDPVTHPLPNLEVQPITPPFGLL